MSSTYPGRIADLLSKHYDEAVGGLVDKSPSRLLRGEGTERPFYIMKIDLVGSTTALMARRKATYLKLAHVYLSTVDQITQDFGADPNQVEYAGDSVLAYFPETDATAEDVLSAACYARAAVSGMRELDETLSGLKFGARVVLHHGTLLVSKIGPRAGSILTAIGTPIHKVAKLEKEVSPGAGRATVEFRDKLDPRNRRFLIPVRQRNEDRSNETGGLIPAQGRPLTGHGQFDVSAAIAAQIFGLSPVERLSVGVAPSDAMQLQPVVGYSVNWLLLNKVLGAS